MKNIIKKALLISSTLVTFNTMADIALSLDVSSCAGNRTCELNHGVVLTCASGNFEYNSWLFCRSTLEIQSTKFPISELKTMWKTISYEDSVGTATSSSIDSTQSHKFSEFTKKIFIRSGRSAIPALYSLVMKETIHGDLKATAASLNKALGSTYEYVSNELEIFKNNIAKSHMGHTLRFQKALAEGQKILSEKNKDGKYLYSILDWRVQENARLVVAFGGILDELLAEYDHVDTLKSAISNMRILVSELRDSYGWNRAIGGNVSKASATLLDVVRLELQELGMIKMSVGASVTHYQKLLKISGDLLAKVNAAKSGDMRAQREIYGFLDAWNSKEWQDELDILVNAEADVKNLVTPKLVMLLQAMESIEDLTEAGFEVPKLD